MVEDFKQFLSEEEAAALSSEAERVRRVAHQPSHPAHAELSAEMVRAKEEHQDWAECNLWHRIVGSSTERHRPRDIASGAVEEFIKALVRKHSL